MKSLQKIRLKKIQNRRPMGLRLNMAIFVMFECAEPLRMTRD